MKSTIPIDFLETLKSPKLKRLVVLVIVINKLETNLELVNKQDGTVLVLIQNSANGDMLSEEARKAFHLVLDYHLPVENLINLMTDTASLHLPSVDEYIKEMVLAVNDASIVRLIAWEELTMMDVARIREVHGIEGPCCDEITRFTDKKRIKQIANGHQINCARFTLQTLPNDDIGRVIADVTASVGFPVFFKPQNGVACSGSAHLLSEAELRAWLQQKNKTLKTEGSTVVYLAEQSMGNFEETDFYYFVPARGFDEFCQRSLSAFDPSPRTIAAIQGFYDRTTGDGYICEMVGRFIQPTMVKSIQATSGINCEELLINANLDDNYVPPLSAFQGTIDTRIRYLSKQGVLRSHKQFDYQHNKNLNGQVYRTEYLVPIGQSLQNSNKIRDAVCDVLLIGQTISQLFADIETVMRIFQPEIS